jgi:hypothetical protein
MAGEGRFIDTLGDHAKTKLPGGADVDGDLKVKDSKLVQDFFNCEPLSVKKAGAGAATGTAGDENLMKLNGPVWEYHILGTQTIVSPTMGVGGLDVNMDQTDNDGVEVCLGINAANKGVFTVGTDAAFYAKMAFSIADVSGTDDCAFGFRKVEAYQANLDDYDEMACLNVISGNITIETILNGGVTTSTDTTNDWADAATHTLEVFVSAAGVVTYKIDGSAPTTTAAFTFDDAEVVVPFFYFLNASDVAGEVVLKEFECGLQ